ncbi:MAG: 50S ribosomal protein L6 [Planctomycetes bacterium]|nr:50S ribosomal protein L6 [Planctomycetota bacterium]MCB9910378.1 50S ribosomal protein L6 [Planctomycetota bacterium]MCB9912011.1 50S ribosomal protein L6 [Planctomycetota bacterium]HPF14231.1 50S ribosomal protein L6 [Planctomycetota bacterium]HRV79957.1 50S ribosomal protein L6 [Planctomycetota bacterium]
MSRIGKAPISIPGGVTLESKPNALSVKGPKGTLSITLRPEVKLVVEGQEAKVELTGSGPARQARAYHGLTRALVQNMVLGVTQGFEKRLEIVGVGWNAKAAGSKLVLNIGFCHTVDLDMPQGVSVETPAPTKIVLAGADKQAVGQIAAVIRAVRPPEPYKGKGIRYEGEFVRRKSGKSFGS